MPALNCPPTCSRPSSAEKGRDGRKEKGGRPGGEGVLEMSTSETQDEKDRENKREREPERCADLRPRPARADPGVVPGAVPQRGAAVADRVRRALPRAGRRDPRAAPRAGRNRATGLGGRRGASRAGQARAGDPRPAGGRQRDRCVRSAAGLAAAVGDEPGPWPERLGDYRILGCIGEGGMGVVYEAVRESLKQPRGAQGHAPTVPRQRRLPPAVP